jgi:hypothetical protein
MHANWRRCTNSRLSRECLDEIGSGLGECSLLRVGDVAYLDRLLDAVRDPQQRLLLCRLAAAAITADGRVTNDERLVYDHVLARWHINRSMVTEAILHDTGGRAPAARPMA